MNGARKFQAFNAALTETDGSTVFYRSGWSRSSSLLPMLALHKEIYPYTAGESKEIVPVRRTDQYGVENEILVKLDVQGSEDRVIAGGKCLLQRAKVLIVETSTVPLYDQQPLFREIFMALDSQGFKFLGVLNQSTNPSDGSILQADSIFIHEA